MTGRQIEQPELNVVADVGRTRGCELNSSPGQTAGP